MLGLLHYEEYFPHRYHSTIVQRLVQYFHVSEYGKCASSVQVKLYAVGTNKQLSVAKINFVEPS